MGLGRVLVIDDEEHVRKTVRAMLTKGGYDVVVAEDGEMGIKAMKSDDNALMVDVILCDIHMPNINGTEAIAYFRSQFPSVPVIVITGQPDLQGVSSLFKQGVVDYLVKPLESAKVLTSVGNAAKGHGRTMFSGR
jgi:two-component system chemotaxis response regulator CheY